MSRQYLPALVVAAFLLNGCVIHEQVQPKVEGRLVDSNGKPVADAMITLDYTRPASQTVTDHDGYFAFEDKYEWQIFIPIGPADKFVHVALRIDAGEQQYESSLGGGVGGALSFNDLEFSVLCTLPATAQPESNWGICRNVPVTTVQKEK